MLNFTPKERRALIILLLVLLASALVQWALPGRMLTKGYDYTLEDSLFAELAADTMPPSILSEVKSKKRQPQVSTVPSNSNSKSLPPHSINVNTAQASRLVLLPGIGPKTAQAIVAYRQAHGPFREIKALKKVKRIGPKTLEKIKPYITIKDGN